MPLTVLIEPDPSGHHFQFVAIVARIALRRGDVTLLTRRGAQSCEEFTVYLADLPITVEECFVDAEPTTVQVVSRVKMLAADRPVSQVVVMDGDNALKTWWHVAAREFCGLKPRPSIAFLLTRWSATLERGGLTDLYYLRVKAAKVVLLLLARSTRTIDHCAGFVSRDESSPGWLVKRARDPAICEAHSRDRTDLRKELSLSPERRLIGIFGGVNIRKNPVLALDAVIAAGPENDLILAGPMDAEFAAWVKSLSPQRRGRVIVRDGFLPNELLDKYLAASDVVLLLMTLEGPSGIMGKALAADVPVVTAGSRTRARELEALHRGAATDYTVADVARGLQQVVDSPGTVRADAPDLPTADTFGATVLGLPDADPALRRLWPAPIKALWGLISSRP